MSYSILQGDCRTTLAQIADKTVQTCITSPPYFGLRDYGMDDQMGLEKTPQAFVAELVAVFREVRRVLKDNGTVWLNLGDSYATGTKAERQKGDALLGNSTSDARAMPRIGTPDGLKTKDLIGIPWRVALALQDDGWYLRQDIIWHKPNPMPESVTDRCTKSHEYIFLLSKSPVYYFNHEAIKEPVVKGAAGSSFNKGKTATHQLGRSSETERADSETRNKRSVWSVATAPYKEAHFATFPPKLIEPCVLAGSKPGDLVLDIFNGSGTTGQVALQSGREYIGCELNPEYVALTHRRLSKLQLNLMAA